MTQLGAFQKSPLGSFVQSPLGARNRKPEHIIAMVFIDGSCKSGPDPDEKPGYLDQFCNDWPTNTATFDSDRFAFRRMRRNDYSVPFRQLQAGLLHVPWREAQGGTLVYRPVVPSTRFASTFGRDPPDVYYRQALDRPADLKAMKLLFLQLEVLLNGESFALQLFIFITSPNDVVQPILREQFIPWLHSRGVVFRPGVAFETRRWFLPLVDTLSRT